MAILTLMTIFFSLVGGKNYIGLRINKMAFDCIYLIIQLELNNNTIKRNLTKRKQSL